MTYAISYPRFKCWDRNGAYLVGGKVYSYVVGTDTPTPTFSDVDCTVSNQNPVILDAMGEADLFISGSVKLVVKDSLDNLLFTIDEVSGSILWTFSPESAGVLYSSCVYGGTQTILQAAITAVGASNATLYLTPSSWIINSNLTVPANITIKAERGAVLTVTTGTTLTFSGGFDAGIYQVFDCQGTGQVVFGAGTVEATNPEWWGGNQSGMAAALLAFGANAGTIKVTSATTLTNDLTVPANIDLVQEAGGVITVPTTKTLTINGGLQAGVYQIFSCIGTGAVVLGKKVAECYPQWFGAVADGATDDGAAIIAAAASLSNTGCKRLVFPPGSYRVYTVGQTYTGFGPFTSITGLQVVSQGATLAIDPARTFTTQYGTMFLFHGCHNVLIDGFNVTGPTLTLTNLQNKEAVEFVRADTLCTNINMPYNRLQGVGAGFITYVNVPAEAITNKSSNINIGIMEVSNSVYGVACGFSGDGLTISTLKTDGVYRSYFVYGCKGHKVMVISKDPKAIDARIDAKLGYGCEDMELTYINTESTAVGAACNYFVGINYEDQTAATIRNVKIDFNVAFGGSGDTGSSAFIIRKTLDDGATNDTVDRGHVLDNLTVGGYVGGTPSVAGTPLVGTNPGCTWGDSGTPDVWTNINFKNLRVNSTTACAFATGALSGTLSLENVYSPNSPWWVRKNNATVNPAGKVRAVGSDIKNLWIKTNTSYDPIMNIRLYTWAVGNAYTLDAKESGKTISSEGVTATTTVTLPTAVSGLEYTFERTFTGAIRIVPATGDQINGSSAPNKYLSLDSQGATVTLRCQVLATGNIWQVVSAFGTTSFQA